ncbi:hypothetical protein [Haloglycomyces albus]|uniref:hypothetical protein n=1 Tax=Haloglycomyces albus TaxID=526067 RepID=UPI00046CC2B3|nr:hypothetical protein [Haloglycomyces albus]
MNENEVHDDRIREAFQSYRDETARFFPTPDVNDILYAAPNQRRRRIVSISAALGTAGLVTAGSFAVAQTVGEPEEVADTPPVVENSETTTPSEEPLWPPDNEEPNAEMTEEPGTEPTTDVDTDVLTLNGWPQPGCEGGELPFDAENGAIAAESEANWAVRESTYLDVTGDGNADRLMTLSCNGQQAVGLFSNGSSPQQRAWAWQGAEGTAVEDVAVDDAHLTIDVRNGDDLHTVTLAWDGSAFQPVEPGDEEDDDPSTDEPSDDPSSTPDEPDE